MDNNSANTKAKVTYPFKNYDTGTHFIKCFKTSYVMSILLACNCAGFECELIQRYCHSLLCEFKLCGKYSHPLPTPPCFHSKKKKKSHYFRCPQTCQVPAHCFMIPAFYGKKPNLKRQHSFYITTDILEKGHY